MPTFRAAFVRLLNERVRTKQVWYVGCHTQLVPALVPADRCDSYRSPDILGTCGSMTLVSTCGGKKMRWRDGLEGIRHLTLPASTRRGLLDLVDILTVSIVKTWSAILRLALLRGFRATDNHCGSVVNMRTVKVGSRSGGDGTHATRRAFCYTDDSRDARWETPPKRSEV